MFLFYVFQVYRKVDMIVIMRAEFQQQQKYISCNNNYMYYKDFTQSQTIFYEICRIRFLSFDGKFIKLDL